MRKIFYILFVLNLLTTNVNAQKQADGAGNKPSKKTAPLNVILKEVSEVLKEVETKSGIPKPTKVSVTFETENSTETGAGIKILIFKFGRKWSKAESSEVSYDFEINPAVSLDKSSIRQSLAKAITEAINQITSTDTSTLTPSGFTVKVGFTIEKSTVGEAEYEISPVTPSLDKSWKKKAVHSVEIAFEKDNKE